MKYFREMIVYLRRHCFGGIVTRKDPREGDANIVVGEGCLIHTSVHLDTSKGGSIRIGCNCTLEQGVLVDSYGGEVEIGDRVYLGPYAVVYGHGGLKIGSDTMIATHAVIIPANHGSAGRSLMATQPLTKLGINIGSGSWIGCGAKILDGVEIGEGCVVGAGSVVSRSVPDYGIAVGVPARVIRFRKDTSQPLSQGQGGESV